MKPISILHICDQSEGGIAIVVLTTAQALVAAGHRVRFLGRCREDPGLQARAGANGVEMVPWNGFKDLHGMLVLAEEVRHWGGDLVVSHHRGCDVIVGFLCMLLGRRHAIHNHEIINATLSVSSVMRLTNPLWRFIGRRAVMAFNISLPTHRSALAFFTPSQPERWRIIDNPLSTIPATKPTGGATIPTVIALGRVAGEKRPELFIAIIEQLAAHLPVRGRWYGEGTLRPAMQQLAMAACARQPRLDLQFPGRTAQVAELLAQAQVFVHLRADEGFGLVFTEAMAAGLPVVAARGGNSGELVEDGVTGLLFAPDDIAGCLEALLRLLGDEQLRLDFGAAGLARVGRFHPLTVAKDYAHQVREVLDG